MSEERLGLAEALADVRRAYRLLHAYHRRLCDLLQVTDELLSERGLAFDHWSPLNVARLPNSNRPFFRPDNWAWDLTPGYQIQCVWRGFKDGTNYNVHIHAVADTGYDTSRDGEPDPIRFLPAEKSRSELRIGLWRTRAKDPNWGAAWKPISRITNRQDGNEHTAKVDGDEYTHRYFDLDLAELVDEQAVKERLLLPLERWITSA